ncbi:MAG: TspO/MBR family protein [Bryobacteraceae bacterium]
MRNKLALVGWIALCLAAGGLGSLATSAKIPTWYATLAKPSWNPPNWLFAPVWTTLFVLMAVAAWMVWTRRAQASASAALVLFAVQLVLNTLWSFLFFGAENPGAAMLEIVVLWIAIAATIWTFRKISSPAAWLLAPYLAWVSFASCLNYAIWQLNP